jgi:phage recombination protein Bet
MNKEDTKQEQAQEPVAQVATAKKSEAVEVRGRNNLLAKMGERYGVDGAKLWETLKATAFKGGATNEQMMALCIVADQYQLNPFTREIYAFPDKNNGIVPVVGVDGWLRIINGHPQFDGMEFDQDADSCTCRIHRKDRAHAIEATEYLAECQRNTAPWGSHPKRMLRHKAIIQAARMAFGFVGIYDPDEADRIREAQDVEATPAPYAMPRIVTAKAEQPKEGNAQ